MSSSSYRGRGNPGWLVEGIADYIRWFKSEPESQRPRPNPAKAKYTDSYRTTAAFLNYVEENVKKGHREETQTPPCARASTAPTSGRNTPARPLTTSGDYLKTLEKR